MKLPTVVEETLEQSSPPFQPATSGKDHVLGYAQSARRPSYSRAALISFAASLLSFPPLVLMIFSPAVGRVQLVHSERVQLLLSLVPSATGLAVCAIAALAARRKGLRGQLFALLGLILNIIWLITGMLSLIGLMLFQGAQLR
jgi:hypothetical protein